MPATGPEAIVVPSGEGKTYHVLDTPTTLKLVGGQTNGAFALIELAAPPQSEVPRHLHSREDETFYLLEGSLEIQCGGRTFRLNEGSTLFLPRHVPHAYRNPGKSVARIVVLITPAGFEQFFVEIGQLPTQRPLAFETVVGIGQTYGLTFPIHTGV